ncbi:hypothetical protein [Facklamia sp. 7083-14-GEN3]|uniref:hypothetical protein n=1 Tax=Facklamia sp. 7083-14-GEN3 TaxID=2973478 RepID=UPI00215B8CCC|nr:hypothetical protein [Facklamia sp. 7083-14-GEN3]MCR8969127.1 hypothetical protein [Facklamia sp. 7083-14-GEN3]
MNYSKQMIKYFSVIAIGLLVLLVSHYAFNQPIVGKLTAIEGKDTPEFLPDEYVNLKAQSNIFSLPEKMFQNKKGDYQLSRSKFNISTQDFKGNTELEELAKDVPSFFKRIASIDQVFQGEDHYFWIESDYYNNDLSPVKVHFLDKNNKKEIIKEVPLIKTSTQNQTSASLLNVQSRLVDGKYYLMCVYNIESGNGNDANYIVENKLEIFQLDKVDKDSQYQLINEESYQPYGEEKLSKDVWFSDSSQSTAVAIDAPFIQTTYYMDDGQAGPFYIFDFKEQAWQELEFNSPEKSSFQLLTADSNKLYVLELQEDKNYLGYYSLKDQSYTDEIPLEHFESLNDWIDIQVIDHNKEGKTLLALNDFTNKYYGYYDLNTGQTDSLFRIDFPKAYHKFLDLSH